MKIAIIVVSSSGYELAKKISEKLEEDPTIFKVDIFQKNVKNTLKQIFSKYEMILGIMATGIMVRNLCKFEKNKFVDPGVLVMDDLGSNVISLLSGHIGGSNAFATKISKLTNANAVITTSTDVHGKIGIDELARQYLLGIQGSEKIKIINSAIIENKNVNLSIPPKFKFLKGYSIINNTYSFSENSKDDLIKASTGSDSLELKPKKFVIGIGSKKGVSKIKVDLAVKNALNYLNIPIERIDSISTAEMKKYEQGITDFALEHDIPLEIIPHHVLKDFKSNEYDDSPFVKEIFGVGGVCQPCALISAGENSHLILKKIAFNGVTVAAAISP